MNIIYIYKNEYCLHGAKAHEAVLGQDQQLYVLPCTRDGVGKALLNQTLAHQEPEVCTKRRCQVGNLQRHSNRIYCSCFRSQFVYAFAFG